MLSKEHNLAKATEEDFETACPSSLGQTKLVSGELLIISSPKPPLQIKNELHGPCHQTILATTVSPRTVTPTKLSKRSVPSVLQAALLHQKEALLPLLTPELEHDSYSKSLQKKATENSGDRHMLGCKLPSNSPVS